MLIEKLRNIPGYSLSMYESRYGKYVRSGGEYIEGLDIHVHSEQSTFNELIEESSVLKALDKMDFSKKSIVTNLVIQDNKIYMVFLGLESNKYKEEYGERFPSEKFWIKFEDDVCEAHNGSQVDEIDISNQFVKHFVSHYSAYTTISEEKGIELIRAITKIKGNDLNDVLKAERLVFTGSQKQIKEDVDEFCEKSNSFGAGMVMNEDMFVFYARTILI